MAFPTNLTNAADNTTDVVAAHLNNLEAKVGVDGSAVETSHDYKIAQLESGKVDKAGDTMTGELVLAAGSTTVAPIKMVAGINLTTPVAGVFEFDGTNLFFSIA